VTRVWLQAVRAGDLDSLAHLAAEGLDVNARDEYGQTALMLAARAGHGEVVRWLVARGADLDHTAKFGLSALMLAALGGHAVVARVLVDAGADPTLRGTGAPGFTGKTAFDLAPDEETRRVLRTSDVRL
jgi:ankyrin repeat protein